MLAQDLIFKILNIDNPYENFFPNLHRTKQLTVNEIGKIFYTILNSVAFAVSTIFANTRLLILWFIAHAFGS